MSNATRTFRNDVPDDLVKSFFSLVGVSSFSDFHWWNKNVFTPSVCEKIDCLLPELEPYYYPHKKFIVQRNMNPNRYIQILRQLAKAKGMILESKEYKNRDFGKRKITIYRLKSEALPVRNDAVFTMSFD